MKRFIVVLLAAVLTLGTMTAFASPTPAPVPTPTQTPVQPQNQNQNQAQPQGQAQEQAQAPAESSTEAAAEAEEAAAPIEELFQITLDKVEEVVDDLLKEDKLPGGEKQAEAMKGAYAALADPNGTITVSEFVSSLTKEVKVLQKDGKEDTKAEPVNLDDYDFTSKKMNHLEVDTSKGKSEDGLYSVSLGKTDLPDQLNADTINDMYMVVYDYSAGQSGEMLLIKLDVSMLSDTVPPTLNVTVPCEEFDFTFITKKEA